MVCVCVLCMVMLPFSPVMASWVNFEENFLNFKKKKFIRDIPFVGGRH